MKSNRIAAFLLVLLMTVSLLPTDGHAAGETAVTAAPLTEEKLAEDGTIRVWLKSLTASSYDITVLGDYTIDGDVTRQIPYNSKIRVSFSGNTLYLSQNGSSANMGSSFTLCRHAGGKNDNALKIEQSLVPDNLYPGDLQFTVSDGTLYVICHIYVEDYLYGVLPYEMDNSFPQEALRAQAVAARTYAIKAKKTSGIYDVTDTTNDQVFRGVNRKKTNCIQAVDDTWGIVLKYNGACISAYYGASNGGQTETPENAWKVSSVPYLTMHDDPFDVVNTASVVKKYTVYSEADRERNAAVYSLLQSELAKKLGSAASSYKIEKITDVYPVNPMYAEPSRLYTQMHFDLTSSNGQKEGVDIDIFPTLKNALGLAISCCTNNELLSVQKKDGNFVIEARRYGHGIGMSQRGAQQMARDGYGYAQILGFYYTDVTRVRMNFTRSLAAPVDGSASVASPTPAPVEDASSVTFGAEVKLSNASDFLNLRAGASTASEIIGKIPSGAKVGVTIDDGIWCKVTWNGKTGYVSRQYLVFDEEQQTAQAAMEEEHTQPIGNAVVTLSSGSLNLREQASSSAKVIATMANGSTVSVMENGDSWSRVNYGNRTGYAATRYLAMVREEPSQESNARTEESTTDSSLKVKVSLSENGGNLNLRAGASTSSGILATIPNGTELSVLSAGSIWTKVSYAGTEGYVMNRYLSGLDSKQEEQQRIGEVKAVVTLKSGKGKVNLRAGASSGAAILTTVPHGTAVNVLERGTAWTSVNYQGFIGFISSEYLKFEQTAAEPEAPVSMGDAKQAYVTSKNGGYVNLREQPSTSAKVLRQLSVGTGISFLGDAGNGWYQVSCQDVTGYMMSAYVRLDEIAQTQVQSTDKASQIFTTVINSGKTELNCASASLLIREQAEDLADIVGTLKQHERVDVLGWVGADAEWLYVRSGAVEGFARRKFFDLDKQLGRVRLNDAESTLIMRASGSAAGKPVGSLRQGTIVSIQSTQGAWLKIKMTDGTTGYVSAAYLEILK